MTRIKRKSVVDFGQAIARETKQGLRRFLIGGPRISRPSGRTSRRPPRLGRTPRFEPLEPRLALAVVIWQGANDDWDHIQRADGNFNWSNHALPAPTDDVIIPGGTVTKGGQAATIALGNAILKDATFGPNTSIVYTGGDLTATLDNVSIAGSFELSNNQRLWVQNGLDLQGGEFRLGKADGTTAGFLVFTGASQHISGVGEIILGGSVGNGIAFYSAGDLTIESNISIHGKSGAIGGRTGSAGVLVNQGTIRADVPGGTLGLFDSWVNTGTIEVSGAGSTLNLAFTTTTLDLGDILHTAGTINFSGSLDNQGQTLTFDAVKGSWNFLISSVFGGAIATIPGQSINIGQSVFTNVTFTPGTDVRVILSGTDYQASTTFDNVTLLGQLNVANGYVWFRNNLNVDHGVVLIGDSSPDHSGHLYSAPGQTQSILGIGTITMGKSASNALAVGPGGTLTIDQGIVVNGENGSIRKLVGAGSSGNNFINRGTIHPTAAAGTFTLTGGWTNEGTIRLDSNSTLNLNFDTTTAGLGNIEYVQGTINYGGTLDNTSSTLLLDNSKGVWHFLAGMVFGGTIKTAGSGGLTLSQATFKDLLVSAGVEISVLNTGFSCLLDNVTVAGTLTTSGNAYVAYKNNLTLSGGTINLGDPLNDVFGQLRSFETNQSILGSGQIVFGQYAANALSLEGPVGSQLTIAPGITLRGKAGYIGGFSRNLINQGTIDLDTANGQFTLDGNLTNAGTIRVTANASLNLTVATTTAGLGEIEHTAGTISFGGHGALDNTNSTLLLDSTRGRWNFYGGSIVGGAIAAIGSGRFDLTGVTLKNLTIAKGTTVYPNVNGIAATLDNVTVAGTLDMTGHALISFFNNLTLQGGLVKLGTPDASTGDSSRLFTGATDQTIRGAGEIIFGAGAANGLGMVGVGNNLTIAPGITIHGQNGVIGFLDASINTTLINQGVIQADVAGGVLSISKNWTNVGTVRAKNGGTIDAGSNPNLHNTPTNVAAGTLTGGTWEVYAGSSIRLRNAPITANAANILLDGPDAKILTSEASTTDTLVTLLSNTAAGSFTIQNGRNFLPLAGFSNSGQLTVGAGSTFGVRPPPPLSTGGLVSRWNADGNVNDSVGSNNGTMQNGASYSPGLHGQAFQLDGINDFVDIPDSPSLRPTNLTLEGWFKFDTTPTGLAHLFGKPLGNGFQDSYAIWYQGGSINACISDGGLGIASFAYTPDLGVWHHVAMTFDDSANTLLLYLDGVQRATLTTNQTIAYDSRPLRFGADIENGSDAYFVPGATDDIALWNRVLTPSEIHEIYSPTQPLPYMQTGGTTTLSGGSLVGDVVTIQAGSLQGTGAVKADVVNAGKVAPGNAIGALSIEGNYTQSAVGSLDLELAGTTAGTQYDRISVTGQAQLAGTLNVALANGYGPLQGQIYMPATFASRSGSFAGINMPSYAGSPLFSAVVGATDVTLTALQSTPDLDFLAMSIPVLPGPGATFAIPYSVKNVGIVPAVGNWSDKFYLSNDQILDADDILLGTALHSGGLTIGASYGGTLTAMMPSVAGEYYVLANVSADAPDPNRANNVGLSEKISIAVDSKPLVLSQTTLGTIETPLSIDRYTFTAAANQPIQFHLLGASPANSARFSLTGPNGEVAFADLISSSESITSANPIQLPVGGEYTLTAVSNTGGTGSYSFRLDAPTPKALTIGTTYSGTFDSSAQFFKVDVPTSGPLVIYFDDPTAADRVDVFGRPGDSPSPRVYDVRNTISASHHQITVPFAPNGSYYILVSGANVSFTSTFTLRVEAPAVGVNAVTPNQFSVGSTQATVIVDGFGFVPGSQVALIPAGGGTAIAAQSTTVDRSTRLSAMFNLAAQPIGNYNVRVTLPGGASSTLASSVHVVAGQGELETKLILPSALGRHQPATMYVEYANVGTAPLVAPLLKVHSEDEDDSDKPLLTLDESLQGAGLWTSAVPAGFDHEVNIYATGATPGWLLPGERVRVPIYYVGLQQPWNFSDTAIELGVGPLESTDTRLIDYNADFEKPDWVTDDAWPAIRANLQAQIGPTWGDYVQMLGRNATYLSRFGQSVTDVSELYRLEFEKANGLSSVGTLAAALDAVAPSPGLTITFDRSFGNTITSRYADGLFGRGWDAPAQAFLEVFGDGILLVHESNDGMRRFQPDSRHVGAYLSQTGDAAVMKAIGGGYELTETSGFKSRYRADGKLEFIQDVNGNRITYGYTGSQLTSMTGLTGGSLTISYNAAGRINQIVDSAGRTTTYNYDATNTLLLSVTGPAGTTNYTYSTGQGVAREYALLSVTGPDGLTQHYDYDTRGRLIASFLDSNVERVNFTYDGAKVTGTDLAGVFSNAFFDADGLLVRSEDALGHFVVYQYNPLRQLIKTTDDLGRTVDYTRCDCGRPKTITDVYGRTILTFTLGGPNNQPLAFTDANNNVTKYGYDAKGNLTSTTYMDGTIERATYDAAGNLDTTTNRRGQIVDRTVNTAGQVTHEVWSDGTVRDYTYDTRGRLKTAVDSVDGTTTLDYDTADRLKRVDYPGNRWITYNYDTAGRRTQVADNSGFATNYEYDPSGRLKRLRDAANALLVEYTYDAAGRLIREDKGNGTYTLYGYDAAGHETSIVNYAPNNSINSKFIYTYDAAGRRDTQTTIDGVWTYSYDLVDQLTHAVFASTNPSIPNQNLSYEYDALGNRTRTIENGATTVYAANSMNQYTSAGGTIFTYDSDGNLIKETGPDGEKHYTYDQLNRLIRVVTPEGAWDYEYDILGNRSAVIHNGQRTEYLVDPQGLGNVIGEYNGAGTRTNSYTHGLGLESMAGAGGAVSFYDFDAIGSTTGLSGAAGTYVDRYVYNPWGESLLKTEAIANSFEFVGQSGVMDEGNGLIFMRARYFLGAQGRFLSDDPIRLTGGSPNLYSYALQNPINVIDATGLCYDPVTEERTRLAYNRLAEAINYYDDLEGVFRRAAARSLARAWNEFNGGFYDMAEVLFRQAKRDAKTADDYKFRADFNRRAIDWLIKDIEDFRNKPCPKPQECPDPKNPGCIIELDESDMPGGIAADASDEKVCKDGPPVPVPMAMDPNEKFGAAGYGPWSFIDANVAIPYRINFENLGPGSEPAPTTPASAPAQRVDVTDKLSADLDWSSLEFTEFGFGDIVVAVPPGSQYFFQTVGLTYNGKFFNVEVELNFDPTTGQLSAAFQSVDPANGLTPDVLTGFLPPEDGTGIGKAHLAFSVKPKANLPTGTELRNVAYIRFDGQTVIPTNQIDPQDPSSGTDPAKEALNTLDAVGPTSSVNALPATSDSTVFTVFWSGADDANGSGIAHFDVFVSVDNGPFTTWLTETPQTSDLYHAVGGHTYRFYSVASDNVGHEELAPAVADAVTMVPAHPGDVNDDGFVNIFDINLVSAHWNQAGPTGDANHDGTVNIFDINLISANWTPTITVKPGDVNADGAVNIFDINLVSSHWNQAGPQGDANHDGVVNIFDINLISANWTPPGGEGSGAAMSLESPPLRIVSATASGSGPTADYHAVHADALRRLSESVWNSDDSALIPFVGRFPIASQPLWLLIAQEPFGEAHKWHKAKTMSSESATSRDEVTDLDALVRLPSRSQLSDAVDAALSDDLFGSDLDLLPESRRSFETVAG